MTPEVIEQQDTGLAEQRSQRDVALQHNAQGAGLMGANNLTPQRPLTVLEHAARSGATVAEMREKRAEPADA
mgnify:CR=1 FL=1